MKHFKVTVQPTVEPLTRDEVKEYLAIAGSSDDVYLDNLIKAARQQFETYLSRILITQTCQLWLDGCDIDLYKPLYLWRPEIQSVSSIKLYDTDNAETTWDSSNYTVQDDVIFLNKNVSIGVSLRAYKSFVVEYIAGYGNAASDVPEALRQAMLDFTQYMHECGCDELPGKIKIQLNSYKSLNWNME